MTALDSEQFSDTLEVLEVKELSKSICSSWTGSGMSWSSTSGLNYLIELLFKLYELDRAVLRFLNADFWLSTLLIKAIEFSNCLIIVQAVYRLPDISLGSL